MKEKIQGLIPNVLAISFILFLLVYSVILFLNSSAFDQYAKAVLVLSYAAWIFAEMGTTSKEMKEGNTEKDEKSLEFYALSRGVMITITILFSHPFEFFSMSSYIGLVIFLVSIFFRFYAIRTLGAFYSHRVRVKADHQIINIGPYRFLKHPAYTGMVLANFGFVAIFYSLWGFLSFGMIFLPAIIYRILVEEKILYKIENYEKIMGDKYRLIPFVW